LLRANPWPNQSRRRGPNTPAAITTFQRGLKRSSRGPGQERRRCARSGKQLKQRPVGSTIAGLTFPSAAGETRRPQPIGGAVMLRRILVGLILGLAVWHAGPIP